VRRTALTIVATIVGMVLLLQYKTHPATNSAGALASLGSVPQIGASLRHDAPSTHRTHQTRKPAKTRAPHPITATGQTVQTHYGPVQVRIVKTGGRLTNVIAIQLPSADSHSTELAAQAAPILRSEALRADSARIDVVSGATYTSDGYAQSLQSALDNA
jgi:uncharacterized protein with FMN-binding domain